MSTTIKFYYYTHFHFPATLFFLPFPFFKHLLSGTLFSSQPPLPQSLILTCCHDALHAYDTIRTRFRRWVVISFASKGGHGYFPAVPNRDHFLRCSYIYCLDDRHSPFLLCVAHHWRSRWRSANPYPTHALLFPFCTKSLALMRWNQMTITSRILYCFIIVSASAYMDWTEVINRLYIYNPPSPAYIPRLRAYCPIPLSYTAYLHSALIRTHILLSAPLVLSSPSYTLQRYSSKCFFGAEECIKFW